MQSPSPALAPKPPRSGAELPLAISHNYAVALTFARAGLSVFPCDPYTKRPLVALGFKAATTDGRKINAWWQRWPDALAGVPTSQFWVLDIDANPNLADSMAGLLEVL